MGQQKGREPFTDVLQDGGNIVLEGAWECGGLDAVAVLLERDLEGAKCAGIFFDEDRTDCWRAALGRKCFTNVIELVQCDADRRISKALVC